MKNLVNKHIPSLAILTLISFSAHVQRVKDTGRRQMTEHAFHGYEESMSMDTNQCLANLFLAMGELLAMQGANPHRVRAYRRAAETIFNLPVPIHTIAQRGELQALPSIGKDLAAKIQEFLTTGTIQAYEKLKTPLPPQVREWAKLPGFSEPLVHDLFYRLGITTLDDLERLVRSHLLRTRLRHSGSTQEVLEAIQALRHRHHQPI